MNQNSSLSDSSFISGVSDFLSSPMLQWVLSKLLTLIIYCPQIYLFFKTLADLKKPSSSKTIVVIWCIFFVFLLSLKLVPKSLKLDNNVLVLIRTFGALVIILIPNSILNKVVELITFTHSYLSKMHPLIIYANYKHRSTLRKIQNSISSINKHIKLLPDSQKKQIRDKLLQTIFDQHPKTLTQIQVQCQIISFKVPLMKTFKPNQTLQSFATIKPITKIQSSTTPNISKTNYQIPKKQDIKKQAMIERTPVVTRITAPLRTPMTQSLSFKKSEVVVTQQSPPKHMRTSTPIETSHNKFKKPTLKSELSEKFNVSMSQYSDLLDEQEQNSPNSNKAPQQQLRFDKLAPPTSPKATKKLISKVQIYMQSVTDSGKLEKLFLSLYEGDEIQLTTMNNTVLQVIILLKIINLKNGYHEAKGYSSVAGMCSKVFMFKGDYTAFKKYIEK